MKIKRRIIGAEKGDSYKHKFSVLVMYGVHPVDGEKAFKNTPKRRFRSTPEGVIRVYSAGDCLLVFGMKELKSDWEFWLLEDSRGPIPDDVEVGGMVMTKRSLDDLLCHLENGFTAASGGAPAVFVKEDEVELVDP